MKPSACIQCGKELASGAFGCPNHVDPQEFQVWAAGIEHDFGIEIVPTPWPPPPEFIPAKDYEKIPCPRPNQSTLVRARVMDRRGRWYTGVGGVGWFDLKTGRKIPERQYCGDCGKELSSTLDAYYGRDPALGRLCTQCRKPKRAMFDLPLAG